MLSFLAVSADRGVAERRFDLTVAEHTVPGLLWTPRHAAGPRPLILIAHGGFQHKRIEPIVDLARRFAGELGFAAAALDLPDHGERLSRAERVRQREERGIWVPRGSVHPDFPSTVPERSRIAVVEWRAAIDALQALPEVGASALGFWGVSMGTALGVRLVAAESRMSAAVFGLWGLRAGQGEIEPLVRSISVPVLFLVQRDDCSFPLPTALSMFDAFGSGEKTLHLNPGPHLPLPPYERDASVAFFARHFGAAARPERHPLGRPP